MEVIYFRVGYRNAISKLNDGRTLLKIPPPQHQRGAGLFAQGSGQAPQTGGQGIGTQDRVGLAPCTAPRASANRLR